MPEITTLLLVYGALAHEVVDLRNRHGWHADVYCVPALLHNIAPGI